MKNSKIFTLSLIACLILSSQFSFAVNSSPIKDGLNSEILSADSPRAAKKLNKQALKKQNKSSKFAKRMDKIQAKMAKKGIDFSDPVKKWMWFWIFGWTLGIALAIIAAASFAGDVFGGGRAVGFLILIGLANLIAVFGTASLIVWLVKANT